MTESGGGQRDERGARVVQVLASVREVDRGRQTVPLQTAHKTAGLIGSAGIPELHSIISLDFERSKLSFKTQISPGSNDNGEPLSNAFHGLITSV